MSSKLLIALPHQPRIRIGPDAVVILQHLQVQTQPPRCYPIFALISSEYVSRRRGNNKNPGFRPEALTPRAPACSTSHLAGTFNLSFLLLLRYHLVPPHLDPHHPEVPEPISIDQKPTTSELTPNFRGAARQNASPPATAPPGHQQVCLPPSRRPSLFGRSSADDDGGNRDPERRVAPYSPPMGLPTSFVSPAQPSPILGMMCYLIPAHEGADEQRGCLTQFLVDHLPAGTVMQHWHFSHQKFLSAATRDYEHHPDGWTAIVDGESVSSTHPTYLRRPDVLFVPGMLGPDGLVQPFNLSQNNLSPQPNPQFLVPGNLNPMVADTDADDSATQLSPLPSSRRSLSAAPQESDVEYSHAASPLPFGSLGGEDEAMTDAGLSVGSAESDLCDGADAESPEDANHMDVQYTVAEGADADGEHAHTEDVAAESNGSLDERDDAEPIGPEHPAHDGGTDASEPRPCEVIDLTTDDGQSDGDSNGQESSGTVATLELLYQTNTLPPDELDGICAFFCATPTEIESGFVVPGTGQSLALPQLAFVFQFIKKSLGSRIQPQGQILADATGMGKTHCNMALIAVMRLLLLSEAHVHRHPDIHNRGNTTSPCPAGDPYGIQCVCVAGSLSSRYVSRLTGGPSLVVCPAHLVEQWVARAADFYLPEVKAKGSRVPDRFVELLSWTDGHVVSHPFGTPGVDALAGFEPYPAANLMVGITANPNRVPAAHAKEAMKNPNFTAAIRQLRDKKGVKFEADLNGARAAGQSRLVLVISSSVVSHKTGAAHAFRVPVDIYYAGRSGAAPLSFPMPIVPTLFVFDECHSIKDGSTQFWKRVDDIHRLSSSEPRRTQWCFASATPISTKPLDVASICRVLFNPEREADRVSSELLAFNGRFLKLQSPAGHGTDSLALTAAFAADLARFLKPMIIARTGGSPILDQTVAGSRQGYTKVTKTVSVPPSLAGDLEELGRICREGLSRQGIRPDEGLNILVKMPVFTQYFCAAIMPAIASAQLTMSRSSSTYPSRAVEVDQDIEEGDRGLISRSAHLHQGHDWLREVTRILLMAHGDRGSGSTERQKHVLVIAATPSLTGHLAVILRGHGELLGKVAVHRVSSKSVARQRDGQLKAIEKQAIESQETHVIISTANLVGTGTDALTFCNYLIIFGELFMPHHEGQAVGRVRRRGQRFPVHLFHVRSSHQTHSLVRQRNKGRMTLLSDFGCMNGGDEE
ncbi:uncharacterized protein Triagg1_10875 [Trichoderma aggressivum f. europaeum]|uniref:Helicase ATP-binding domain-containing protein n=1 Tax=Trichoderma aggressivum f. europaeum TaxID=173218 RepID=A0AAE1I4W6_9HYPO|nr:hypothetical protein Triagg1_10875 [Trichoderma aggressivum f. europaeum]